MLRTQMTEQFSQNQYIARTLYINISLEAAPSGSLKQGIWKANA